MKLLRPLAGYTLYVHKTNDYIRRELQITGVLGKVDEYRPNIVNYIKVSRPVWAGHLMVRTVIEFLKKNIEN